MFYLSIISILSKKNDRRNGLANRIFIARQARVSSHLSLTELAILELEYLSGIKGLRATIAAHATINSMKLYGNADKTGIRNQIGG